MSPKEKTTKSQLFTKEECYSLLAEHSVQAMQCYKLENQIFYQEQISSLSKICAALVIHHAQRPQSIVVHMETIMSKEHANERNKIDNEIHHLFNKRKNVSLDTSHGEKDITKLTMQITELEKRKQIKIQNIIKDVIYDALAQACRNNGLEIPESFNIRL